MTSETNYTVTGLETEDTLYIQSELQRRKRRLLFTITFVFFFFAFPFLKAYVNGQSLKDLLTPARILLDLSFASIAIGYIYYEQVYKLRAALKFGQKFIITGKVKRKTSILRKFNFVLKVQIAEGISEELKVSKQVYQSVNEGSDIALEYPYGSKTLLRHSILAY